MARELNTFEFDGSELENQVYTDHIMNLTILLSWPDSKISKNIKSHHFSQSEVSQNCVRKVKEL